MPRETQGGFHMVDHWIRARPGSSVPARQPDPRFRGRVRHSSGFLRLIVVGGESQANEIRRLLDTGASFFDIAAAHSTDTSAPKGGYLGEVQWKDLKPVLAAAALLLHYGENSPVLAADGKFLILGRMPRDFRRRAAEIQSEAGGIKERGDLRGAAEKSAEALRVYPDFLRAIFFQAAAEEQSGNAAASAMWLQSAARLYPNDSTAQFNLGVAQAAAGDIQRAIASYQRAIELDPDHVAAYLNLGAALFSANRLPEAIGVLREGLRVNPISAPLYYSLGLAEQKQGNLENARRALSLAAKIGK
jgi:tetratricopeptide (TPR) repeat protein